MLFYDYADISYDDIVRAMFKLRDGYDNIVSMVSAGISHDKREIPCIKYGNAGENGKYIIISAGVHGRENINPAVLLMIVENMCKKYNRAPEYGKIFDTIGIIFVPVLNPDGYMMAKYGFGAVRNPILREYCENMNVKHYLWKENARYVDINRNFTCRSFKGTPFMPYGDSENETKALIKLFEKYPPCMYIDIHSRGNCIYWYREAMNREYNMRQYEIAKIISTSTGYEIAKKSDENSTEAGGNSVHFASEYYGIPAITIETIYDEAMFPLDVKYYEMVYKRIKNVPYVAAGYAAGQSLLCAGARM